MKWFNPFDILLNVSYQKKGLVLIMFKHCQIVLIDSAFSYFFLSNLTGFKSLIVYRRLPAVVSGIDLFIQE
jgi:hypothetical protein